MTVRASMRRGFASSVGTEQCVSEKAKEVLQLVIRKGPPLTPKQLDYCNEACIGRFLRSKGNHVKKAAKQLRATLSWRANFDVDYLTADEFSAELAAGIAYVAGQDDEGRAVLIVRIKSENLTSQAQKQLLRYFAFTMEVAIGAMQSIIEQCVVIIDIGSLRKGSLALSTIVQLFKLLSDHYPERLARAFVMDAPPMFYYLWKGIGSLLDLGMREGLKFVFTRHYTTTTTTTTPAASHLIRAAESYSDNNDNVWGEQDDDSYSSKSINKFKCHNNATTFISSLSHYVSSSSSSSNSGAALVSDKSKTRSFSFASSWKPSSKESKEAMEFRSFRFQHTNNPLHLQQCEQVEEHDGSQRWVDLSYTESKRHGFHLHYHHNHLDYAQKQKTIDFFRPYYLKFFKCPYNEAAYRTRMKPPLAGLISIISPDLNISTDRQPSHLMERD